MQLSVCENEVTSIAKFAMGAQTEGHMMQAKLYLSSERLDNGSMV